MTLCMCVRVHVCERAQVKRAHVRAARARMSNLHVCRHVICVRVRACVSNVRTSMHDIVQLTCVCARACACFRFIFRTL